MTEKNIEDLLKKALSDETDADEKTKEQLLLKIHKTPQKNGINFAKIIRNTAAVAACFVLSICVAANVSEKAYNTLSRVPIIGSITDVLTFRTYNDSQNGYELYMEVPTVDFKGDESTELSNALDIKELDGLDEVEAQLNKEIDDYINELLAIYEEAKSDGQMQSMVENNMKDAEKHGQSGHYSMTTGYDTVADNDEYFSMRVWTGIVLGSSDEFHKYFTVDKQNGKILCFDDLFPTDRDKQILRDLLVVKMNEISKNNEKYNYWTEEMVIDSNTKFYITDNNEVVIFFDKYDIAPGAMGVQSFIVGIMEDGKVSLEKTAVDEYNLLSGTVYDGTTSFVTVETDDGKLYVFDKQNAEVVTHGEGMIIGNKIDVYYEGSLENPVVKRIELY